jgi:2,4'-dihydroxyacetophenone dioxygenase
MNEMTPPAIPAALQDLVSAWMQRPLIPTGEDAATLHVGMDELPWMEAGDGSAIQLLHVDLNQNMWISNARLPANYSVVTHFHTGHVFAVTHKGSWYYAESPEAVSTAGSYLFEPSGSVHTLKTPADQEGDTIAWFAIFGANLNLDADGKLLSICLLYTSDAADDM